MKRLRQVNISLLLALMIATPLLAATQNETAPNNTADTADAIVETGSYRLYGQLMSETDEDWYSITVTEAGPISIYISEPEYYTYYFRKEFYSSSGVLLAGSKD